MAEIPTRNTRSRLGLQWLQSVVNGYSIFRTELHSPVPHLLQSNTAPSELEITLIRKFITPTHFETVFTNKNSKSNIDQKALARYTNHVRAHDAILSSMRRIPSELLEEIFRHYVTWSANPWRRHASQKDLPWALTQVCQRWRAIALGVPSFWSHIPTINLPDRRRKMQSTIKFLNELLTRSGDAPLTFDIYAAFQDYDTHPVLDALVHHSERWQVVTIESTCTTINALQKSRGRLSSLRKLSLDINRNPGTSVIDFFKDAPRLREVDIAGLYPQAFFLPWSQLTRYRESVEDRGGTHELYASASRLKTLVLPKACDTTIIPVTTFCHLESLWIEWRSTTHDIDPFFRNLTLPAIKEIMIGWSPPNSDVIPKLCSMLLRLDTPCMLQKLGLRTAFRDGTPFKDLLVLTPHLTELDIIMPTVPDLFDLCAKRPGRTLVPLLRILMIHCEYHAPQGDEKATLHNLARSRFRSVDAIELSNRKPLETFRIVFPYSESYSASCLNAQANLADWVSYLEPPSNQLLQLECYRKMLDQAMHYPLSNRTENLISDIEKCEVEDVKNVYMSRLHFSLRQCSLLRPNIIPGDDKHSFPERAGKILEKWNALILQDLAKNQLEWALIGNKSLIYIPKDNPLQTSSEALGMVYGLKDDLDEARLAWSSHM
ncbi:hypothetical protein B0H34DRAFT_183332 [Crassisporium funariophilum]|nr:hypothetical protein B0H34DRAFT_183332 [Crassisporium funariophilum]